MSIRPDSGRRATGLLTYIHRACSDPVFAMACTAPRGKKAKSPGTRRYPACATWTAEFTLQEIYGLFVRVHVGTDPPAGAELADAEISVDRADVRAEQGQLLKILGVPFPDCRVPMRGTSPVWRRCP